MKDELLSDCLHLLIHIKRKNLAKKVKIVQEIYYFLLFISRRGKNRNKKRDVAKCDISFHQTNFLSFCFHSSANRYPTPTSVMINRGLAVSFSIFLRRVAMNTRRLLASPPSPYPQILLKIWL